MDVLAQVEASPHDNEVSVYTLPHNTQVKFTLKSDNKIDVAYHLQKKVINLFYSSKINTSYCLNAPML